MNEATGQVTARCDRLVIGAGIGGLAHAWWARQRGDDVRVLEAGQDVGGVIRSERIDGYQVEWAASSVPSSAENLHALLDDLPNSPELVPASSAAHTQFLLRPTGLAAVPRSPRNLLTTPLLSSGARLRALTEVLRPARRAEVLQHETLSAFITRRFGRAITETFLRPFTSGIYGASPDHLGAADAFPQLVAMEQRYGSVLKGMARKAREGGGGKREIRLAPEGMQALPRAIAHALGSAVETGVRVTRLRARTEEEGPIADLEDGRRIAADEIVLAVPACAQADLLRTIEPALAEQLAAIPYVSLGVAAVGFPARRGPRVPPGFGFLRAADAKARILGATFRSQLLAGLAPPDHELLTVYFGGSEDEALLDEPDKLIRQQVLDDLASALGGRVRPTFYAMRRIRRPIPLFAPGHRGRMAAATARMLPRGIRLLGSHITGISLDHCVAPMRPLAPDPTPVGAVHLAL